MRKIIAIRETRTDKLIEAITFLAIRFIFANKFTVVSETSLAGWRVVVAGHNNALVSAICVVGKARD